MIIKLIPETDIEKAKHKEIEFTGVREFFLVGNRRDDDGYAVDFHEWEGSYKYLLTSLHWFYKVIEDERSEGLTRQAVPVQQIIKRGSPTKPNIQIMKPKIQTLQPVDQVDQELPEEQDVEPQEEAFPEIELENLPKQEIPQLGKIFGKTGKAQNNINLSKEELDEIVRKANKKYAGNEPEE